MSKNPIVLQSQDKTSVGDQLPPKQVSWRSQMPRYVVEVDGQAKSGYPTRDLAQAEADRIKGAFPKLQVRISDWESDSVTNLGPTKAKDVVETDEAEA